jgi:hypothetical protein
LGELVKVLTKFNFPWKSEFVRFIKVGDLLMLDLAEDFWNFQIKRTRTSRVSLFSIGFIELLRGTRLISEYTSDSSNRRSVSIRLHKVTGISCQI